jgi:hypothetical protein
MGFSEEEKRIIRKLRLHRRLRRVAVASLILLSITFVAVFLFLLTLRAQGRSFSSLFSETAAAPAAIPSSTPQQPQFPRPARPSSQMEMPALMPSDTEQASAADRALAESPLQRERRETERARLRDASSPPLQPPPPPQGTGAVSLEPEVETCP